MYVSSVLNGFVFLLPLGPRAQEAYGPCRQASQQRVSCIEVILGGTARGEGAIIERGATGVV